MSFSDLIVRIIGQDKLTPAAKTAQASLSSLGKELTSVQGALSQIATGGLPGVARGVSSLASTVSGSLGPWGLLAGGIAAAAGGLFAFASQSANAAEQLENLSKETGIAVRDLEALQKISEDAGLGTDTLSSAVMALNRQLATEDGGNFARAMAAVGGSMTDANGVMKDTITLASEFGERLQNVASDTERARIAQLGLGRAGVQLASVISDTSKTLKTQVDAMKESGRVVDELTHQRLLAFDAMLDAIAASWDRITTATKAALGAAFDYQALGPVFGMFGIGKAPPGGELKMLPAHGPGSGDDAGPGLAAIRKDEAEADARASGLTGRRLELTVKIKQAEEEMSKAIGAARLPIADRIAGYRQELALIEKQTKLLEDQARLIDRIDKEGYERERRRQENLMELDQKIAGTRPEKILSGDDIKKIRQEQADQAGNLVGLIKGDILRGAPTLVEGFEQAAEFGIESAKRSIAEFERNAERMREQQRRNYEEMIRNIREGAGQVFDAMLTEGKNVFTSLANFARGVLNTALRNIFQNAMVSIFQQTGLSRIFAGSNAGGGGGGTGGGGVAGAVGAAGGLAGLFKFGKGGGGGALNTGGAPNMAVGGAGSSGFLSSAGGGALMGGLAIGGSMLWQDAFKRGSAIEGLAGGAMAGAAVGTMIAPGVGTAIGAGVGAIAGLITGLFGGGAKRRAEEAAKRAAMIEANQFVSPETINLYRTAGEYGVEPDLTGSIRGIGRLPAVNVYVNNNMIDARHAREAGGVIAETVSQQLLAGGSLLADNVAWVSG